MPPEHLRKVVKDHGDMSSKKVCLAPGCFVARMGFDFVLILFGLCYVVVQARQARVLGCTEVHSARCVEAAGELAHALGAGEVRTSTISRDRRHHFHQRNPSRHRTGVLRAVGVDVDHDGTF
jgi:hypothetical protein